MADAELPVFEVSEEFAYAAQTKVAIDRIRKVETPANIRAAALGEVGVDHEVVVDGKRFIVHVIPEPAAVPWGQ